MNRNGAYLRHPGLGQTRLGPWGARDATGQHGGRHLRPGQLGLAAAWEKELSLPESWALDVRKTSGCWKNPFAKAP